MSTSEGHWALPVRRPRGLLVEDSPRQLGRRRDLLRSRHIDVVPAGSKPEAVARLNEQDFKFDVVVTDLDLGAGGNGIEVAELVAEVSGRGVPVYAYTGKAFKIPVEKRKLFANVVLKAGSFSQSSTLLDEAAEAARSHIRAAADRAIDTVSGLPPTGVGVLKADRRDALRDVIPGALPSRAAIDQLIGIGLVELPFGVVLPYELTENPDEVVGCRYAVRILGHEYLVCCGPSPDDAVDSMHHALVGFVELVGSGSKSGAPAIGSSRRFRVLLEGLSEAAALVGEWRAESD